MIMHYSKDQILSDRSQLKIQARQTHHLKTQIKASKAGIKRKQPTKPWLTSERTSCRTPNTRSSTLKQRTAATTTTP
jgi:hypothetical protein